MRVAFISDIHGNLPALEAVLGDLHARGGADRIICGGDVMDPLLSSKDAWEFLKAEGIPVIRGNHEDYIVSCFEPEGTHPARVETQFRPVRLVARHLGPRIAEELRGLPLSIEITPKVGKKLVLCHASPVSNARSFAREPLSGGFGAALEATGAQAIVAGHIHEQWQGVHQGPSREIRLILAGSVGLPLMDAPRPQYALLTFDGEKWSAELRRVEYDPAPALRAYADSGALEEGGPIAWLLYDELRTGSRRLSEFILSVRRRGPPGSLSEEEWELLARDYLISKGTWEEIPAGWHLKR